jgi:hypothetical protein
VGLKSFVGSGHRDSKRAWYPSGPRIDEHGNRIVTETVYVDKPLPNPDPSNYKVVQIEEIGPFLIVQIKYPDCTNFEGNKILVFKSVKLIDLMNQKLIDPHFFESKTIASPIARFTPTKEGWNMAVRFATMENSTQP